MIIRITIIVIMIIIFIITIIIIIVVQEARRGARCRGGSGSRAPSSAGWPGK